MVERFGLIGIQWDNRERIWEAGFEGQSQGFVENYGLETSELLLLEAFRTHLCKGFLGLRIRR